MGREVHRVPLDFNWPLNKVWSGYLHPDTLTENDCPDCVRGYTNAGEWLHTLCCRLGMLASDIRDQQTGRPLHPWLREDTYPPHERYQLDPASRWPAPAVVLRPTDDILDLITGLTGETKADLLSPFGGSNTAYRAAKKIIEAAGLDPDTWGTCTTCQGHGSVEAYPGQRADAENWERTDPPTGEGWQLWATVNEGCPVSPVLPTAEALAQWLTTPAAGLVQTNIDAARRFVEAGWAPSGVGRGGQIMTGVASYGQDRP